MGIWNIFKKIEPEPKVKELNISIVYQFLSNCSETKSMKRFCSLIDDMIKNSLNKGSFTWSHGEKYQVNFFLLVSLIECY